MAIQPIPPNATVLGQGIKYPPDYDRQTGRLKLSWGQQSVEDSIASIVLTRPRERVMNPDYGADIGTFEPVDGERLVVRTKTQIADQEPRAVNVDVTTGLGSEPGRATMIIKYSTAGDASRRTLTFPFFSGPE